MATSSPASLARENSDLNFSVNLMPRDFARTSIAKKPTLCRVRRYLLPGLPRPTISHMDCISSIPASLEGWSWNSKNYFFAGALAAGVFAAAFGSAAFASFAAAGAAAAAAAAGAASVVGATASS